MFLSPTRSLQSPFRLLSLLSQGLGFLKKKPLPSTKIAQEDPSSSEDSSDMSFYAVQRGRNPGIYRTWGDCSREVVEFSGAKYKKFSTREEAQEFVDQGSVTDRRPTSSYAASSSSYPVSSGGSSLRVNTSDAPGKQRQMLLSPSMQSGRTLGGLYMPVPRSTPSPEKASDRVVVYTDGSSRGNGHKGARAGVGVFWGKNDPRNLSERLPGELQTNQRAELTAAIRALETFDEPNKPLEIRTDSQYTIKCATEWVRKWKYNNWKATTGEPVKNVDLIKRLDELSSKRENRIHWVHVYGHKGEEGNEEADKLANLGAEKD